MTNAFTPSKNTVHEANNDQLLEVFKLLDLNEDCTTEETLVRIALVTELKNRGLIAFNAKTWAYELVG